MPYKSLTKVLTAFLIAIQVSGCSTLVARQSNLEEVSFDSNVADAEVNCGGKRTKTPGVLALVQSKSHSCTVEAKCYERKVFEVPSGISWSCFAHSTALNTAATGWWTMGIVTGIGWLMDLGSGAMKNLKEDHVYIEMQPVASLS